MKDILDKFRYREDEVMIIFQIVYPEEIRSYRICLQANSFWKATKYFITLDNFELSMLISGRTIK